MLTLQSIVQKIFSHHQMLVGNEQDTWESLNEYQFTKWLSPPPFSNADDDDEDDDEKEDENSYVCLVDHQGNSQVIKFVLQWEHYRVEERILKDLNGLHHVICLCGSFQIASWKCFGLVFDAYTVGALCKAIHERNLTKTYMEYLLEALAYVHEKGIIHRDVKHDNIGMKLDWKAEQPLQDLVLCDFGLAFYEKEMDEKLYEWNTGTIGYMAPEVMLLTGGREITNAVDIFSAGVVFAELLCGRIGLFETNARKARRSLDMLEEKPEEWFNEKQLSSVDPIGLDLLKKMLEYHPKKRITAKDALNHIYFSKAC